MDNLKIALFFRKPRPNKNFSIERSFTATQEAFDNLGLKKPEWIVLSHYSEGIIPRIKIALEARQKQGHINHVTGDINFAVLGLPRRTTILTVLDCGFLKISNPLKRWILKMIWLQLPVQHATKITAISEATKQEVIAYTGCNPDKIVVVPVVIPNNFEYQQKELNSELPRILHVGTAPNKNLTRHIEALKGIPCCLHIIGKIEDSEFRFLQESGINYENHYNVTEEEIKKAYQDADLLLFASTVEGFGMPILEAQSVGRPVITSNCTSMPEVAGDAACLVNPFEVASIRQGILKVIEDTAYRASLVKKGLENVKRYKAETIALQYWDIYQSVLAQNCPEL